MTHKPIVWNNGEHFAQHARCGNIKIGGINKTFDEKPKYIAWMLKCEMKRTTRTPEQAKQWVEGAFEKFIEEISL